VFSVIVSNIIAAVPAPMVEIVLARAGAVRARMAAAIFTHDAGKVGALADNQIFNGLADVSLMKSLLKICHVPHSGLGPDATTAASQ
jgi:hypothetical protein